MAEAPEFPVLEGPYLGQKPPGEKPELFAPGIVSTGLEERDPSFSPDGTECYFFVLLGNYCTIMETHQETGRWTEPKVASFSGRHSDFEPCFSADGEQLFFASNRPSVGKTNMELDTDIWVLHRRPGGWSEPRPLGPGVNTERMEFFPSLTGDGILYFSRVDEAMTRSDVYRSTLRDGVYQEAEKLPAVVNGVAGAFNAFIAPDESYLLMASYRSEGSFGEADYFVSFRSPEDRWSEPVNLGPLFNTAGKEEAIMLSPDGRYLFFSSSRRELMPGAMGRPRAFADRTITRDEIFRHHSSPRNGSRDVYWVDAALVERLRPNAPPLGER